MIAAATGFVNPGHPGPLGTIALMSLPGEQMPGHAPASSTSGGAHGVLSHAMSPVCENMFGSCASARRISAHFLAASRRRDPVSKDDCLLGRSGLNGQVRKVRRPGWSCGGVCHPR